jgi:hypothetical protein
VRNCQTLAAVVVNNGITKSKQKPAAKPESPPKIMAKSKNCSIKRFDDEYKDCNTDVSSSENGSEFSEYVGTKKRATTKEIASNQGAKSKRLSNQLIKKNAKPSNFAACDGISNNVSSFARKSAISNESWKENVAVKKDKLPASTAVMSLEKNSDKDESFLSEEKATSAKKADILNESKNRSRSCLTADSFKFLNDSTNFTEMDYKKAHVDLADKGNFHQTAIFSNSKSKSSNDYIAGSGKLFHNLKFAM